MQAFDVAARPGGGDDHPEQHDQLPGRSRHPTATVTGTNPFPGPPTGQVQFTVDGTPVGAPVALDGSGNATLVTTALPLGTHQVRARYLGDGDYAAGDSDPVSHHRGTSPSCTT